MTEVHYRLVYLYVGTERNTCTSWLGIGMKETLP